MSEQAHGEPEEPRASVLPRLAREIEDFVHAGGWDHPPQLFALVETSELLAAEPHLYESVRPEAPLTPIAQEQLPDTDLADALEGIVWPESVAGCALAQQIVILPPEIEAELAASGDEPDWADRDSAAEVAASHPDRREARLVAAVLRDGTASCVLRLRPPQTEPDETEQLVEDPTLAPNLTRALLHTFEP
jgi:hypothetical protein